MIVILMLPEPPSSNRYWRHAKGRTYLSAEALAYRAAVAAVWAEVRTKNRRIKKLAGPIAVTLHWHRGRKSGDLDNRIKQLLDALRGWAYDDDKQVVEIHAYRHDKPRHANVVVTIEAAPQQES